MKFTFQSLPTPHRVLAFLALMGLHACSDPSSDPDRPLEEAASRAGEIDQDTRQAIAKVGHEASTKLMKTLGGQLKAAMQSGGPETALQVCQQAAQPLTASTSDSFTGAEVSRVSLRHRNPVNTPGAEARAVLEKWESSHAAGEALPAEEIVALSGEEALFLKPIMVQAICLNCHGDPGAFSPVLRTKLSKLYPDDRAIGFAEGDLRGAFQVRIRLPIE